MDTGKDADRLLELLMLSGPVEWESLEDVLDAVRDAEVLGPDESGEVWVLGRFPDGDEAGEVRLGRQDEPLASAALRWRRNRKPRLN